MTYATRHAPNGTRLPHNTIRQVKADSIESAAQKLGVSKEFVFINHNNPPAAPPRVPRFGSWKNNDL